MDSRLEGALEPGRPVARVPWVPQTSNGQAMRQLGAGAIGQEAMADRLRTEIQFPR